MGGGRGADVLDNPLTAVLWLAGSSMSEGKSLKDGDLLSLGSFSTLLSPKPGTTVIVRDTGLTFFPVKFSVTIRMTPSLLECNVESREIDQHARSRSLTRVGQSRIVLPWELSMLPWRVGSSGGPQGKWQDGGDGDGETRGGLFATRVRGVRPGERVSFSTGRLVCRQRHPGGPSCTAGACEAWLQGHPGDAH